MIRTEYPIYLYGSEEVPQVNDGTLFHFTKFEGFIKIIKTMSLRSSLFSKLNDLNEIGYEELDLDMNLPLMIKTKEYIERHCRIISFSQNYEVEGVPFEGSNHPAMWAHYADNLNGACIVIDEEYFIKRNKEIFNQYFIRFKDVSYSFINAPEEEEFNYNLNTPQEFIREHWEKLFFRKHKDWEYEGERRLFIMDYDGEFNIEGCIKYIVLGKRLLEDDNNVGVLLDMLVNPSSPCYHKFIPASFATIDKSPIGYRTYELGSYLFDKVRKYKAYYDWLCNEVSYYRGKGNN